jgi:hypothetical protein
VTAGASGRSYATIASSREGFHLRFQLPKQRVLFTTGVPATGVAGGMGPGEQVEVGRLNRKLWSGLVFDEGAGFFTTWSSGPRVA